MQRVTIDHGDLSELQQAAEAWAGNLRFLANETRRNLTGLPVGIESVARYTAAADRIDQAIHNTRKDAHEGVHGKEVDGGVQADTAGISA